MHQKCIQTHSGKYQVSLIRIETRLTSGLAPPCRRRVLPHRLTLLHLCQRVGLRAFIGAVRPHLLLYQQVPVPENTQTLDSLKRYKKVHGVG